MEVEPLEESGSERLLPKRKSRPGIFFGAAGYLSEGMPVILSEFLLDEQDPMFARMAGEIIKQGGKPEIEAHCQYGNRMYFNQAHGVLIVAMVREVEQFPESRVVAYLHAVREAFVAAFGQGHPQSFDTFEAEAFSETLEEQAVPGRWGARRAGGQAIFSDMNKPLGTSQSKYDEKIEMLKDQALETLRKQMEREIKLDDVLKNAEELAVTSREFKDSSVAVHKKFWWKNFWFWMAICGGVVLVLLIILMIVCKPTFKEC